MQKIHGQNRTINNLLDKRKYAIDYYQREYRWTTKQVRELIQDLTEKFLEAPMMPTHTRKNENKRTA